MPLLKKNLYISYWKDQTQQGGERGKLRTFKKVKPNFGPDKCIFEINNIQHRQNVTKLRISAHKLYLLKLVGIIIFDMKKEFVITAIRMRLGMNSTIYCIVVTQNLEI